MLLSTRTHRGFVLGLLGSVSVGCAVYDSALLSDDASQGANEDDAMDVAPPSSALPLAGKGGGLSQPAANASAGSAGVAALGNSGGRSHASGGSPADTEPLVPLGGSAAAGAATSLAGASSGGSGEPDPLCNESAAKEGKACTQSCVVPCGFRELGTKTCVCQNGVYSQCSCPRPAAYLGPPTAGYCDTADGSTLAIDETSCSMEWAECIGTDPVSGVTPRGCACITDPELGVPAWVCQSTNGWFILAL